MRQVGGDQSHDNEAGGIDGFPRDLTRTRKSQKELDWDASRVIRAVRTQKGISLQTFLHRLSDEWERRTGELRFFEKLEYGNVHLTRLVIECVVVALAAFPLERAYILEAAGFNGMAELVVAQFKMVLPQVTVALDELIDGQVPIEDLNDITLAALEALQLAGQEAKNERNLPRSSEDSSVGEE
jgi:hypothetical protein